METTAYVTGSIWSILVGGLLRYIPEIFKIINKWMDYKVADYRSILLLKGQI